jgi:hypothetical protein
MLFISTPNSIEKIKARYIQYNRPSCCGLTMAACSLGGRRAPHDREARTAQCEAASPGPCGFGAMRFRGQPAKAGKREYAQPLSLSVGRSCLAPGYWLACFCCLLLLVPCSSMRCACTVYPFMLNILSTEFGPKNAQLV